jgi:hypothetical protein
MKVRLKVSRTGTDIRQKAGDVIDVSAREAAELIETGRAAPVLDGDAPVGASMVQPIVESAMIDHDRKFAPVQRVSPPAKRKRGRHRKNA